MDKPLSTSIQYLKGIGPKRAGLFSSLGIKTIEDLFYYFPRRYEDRTNFLPIAKLLQGQVYTIKARVLASKERTSFKRRGFSIVEAVVSDDSGSISCVWFNQPYLKEYFKPGQELILYGKVDVYSGRLQMNAPEFELVSGESDESLSTGRIVPVYTTPKGVTQRAMRQVIKQALDSYISKLSDFLSFELRSKNNLCNLAKALSNIHFPETTALQMQAYQRLSFDEFFFFQLPLAIRKSRKKEEQGIAHKIDSQLLDYFIGLLPFELTLAQKMVVKEIMADMARPVPMQRLLQGDVGCGKTVVAVVAAMTAIQSGYQAAFMVPTEILAKQHYDKIKNQVSGLRIKGKGLSIGLITSSVSKKEKDVLCQAIAEGEIDLIIGTHALLEEGIKFKNLSLVVIDEQHKFGVGQRALLPDKGINPDVLIMTATPIPRTLAITLYGDLDVSVINQLPAGRLPIKTLLFDKQDINQAYGIVKECLHKAQQAYIIYPVIEESYALDMDGAKKMYEYLRGNQFKEFKIALIHGRLRQSEQDEIMLKFKNRELDVLVATTVLEVGIDIANATCMMIENAERFGLAQLHQLRGRVGRGSLESFCLLVAQAQTEDSRARLNAMVKYSDGFRIAEEDLKIRGPGEFFGRRQHGLSELKIANPLTQMQLLKKARDEALSLVASDPRLEGKQHAVLKDELLQRFPEYEKLIIVG